MVGFSEHGNEFSGSIKGREFFDYLSDYQLLKRTVFHEVIHKLFVLCGRETLL